MAGEITQQLHQKVEELERQRWLPYASFAGAVSIALSGVATIEMNQPEEAHQLYGVTDVVRPTVIHLRPHVAHESSTQPRHASTAVSSHPHHSSTSIKLPHPQIAARQNVAPKPSLPDLIHKQFSSFAEVQSSLANWVERSPGLPELAQRFPSAFPNVPEQLNRIHELDDASTITAEDIKNFHINTDYKDAFASMPKYARHIDPKIFVWHWSVDSYPDGVQQFIHSLMQGGKRVEFFIDKDANVYQLFDSDRRFPAHAKGMNLFSQGVEIEARNLDGYTPEQIKAAKLLTATFLKRNNLTPSPTTFMAHSTGDLLFSNPFYSNNTGTFHSAQGRPASIDKFDPPKELVAASLDDVIALTRS